MRRLAVRVTDDYERVAMLPRREVREADAHEYATTYTTMLREPRATGRLRPWQAYALHEIANAPDGRGAWLALPVGQGKTLITALAPLLVGAERPLLILPASLVDKTWADFASYRGVWRTPNCPYLIRSREELTLEHNVKLLDTLRPDLIILDEADGIANWQGSAVRRLHRYSMANPHVRVITMTGTPSRKSVLDYWHQLVWCLREGAPVPLDREEAKKWGLAIDHSTGMLRPIDPGPLGVTREQARAWFLDRLRSTPGVLSIDEDSCDAPLRIRQRIALEDPVIDDAFASFSRTLESPEGIPVSDPLSRYRMESFLGCGIYSRYVVQPPEEWRAARRAVAKFVRDCIAASAHSTRPLDTEGAVRRRHASHPVVVTWKQIEPTFDPVTEVVWISDSCVRSAHAWAAESRDPGIIWCGCVELGKAIAARIKAPYYGAKGRTEGGGQLHAAPQDRTIVCSWNANKTGFNLQPWARQLFVLPPQSAKWLEQAIGRSHRAGQEREVVIDMLVTSGAIADSFEAAFAEAAFARDTVGLTQKILRARILRSTPKESPSNKYRWARRTRKEEG